MTPEQARALLELPVEQAVERLLELAHKAELWEAHQAAHSTEAEAANDPIQPSGSIPPYRKPVHRGRRKRPGRKHGHPGACRPAPSHIDEQRHHTLRTCPHCDSPLGAPIRHHRRIIEDLPAVTTALAHEHIIEGYWCPRCREIVTPTVTDALPNATLGLRVVVYSAWLHYLLGVSVDHVVRLLAVGFGFRVSPGGLTQAWGKLADQLAPYYDQIARHVRSAAVLHADETCWRVNGVTHWLWGFCTPSLCYFLIDPHRSSAVVARVLGQLFDGFLVCDFYAAYNAVEAWAKQRCIWHLFAELKRVDQRNASTDWREFRRRLHRLFKDAMRLKIRQAELDPALYAHKKTRIHRRLDALINATCTDDDAARLRKRLANFRGELLTFLDHAIVTPANDLGERQMRKPVANRKICQQNRSERGAATYAMLLSLFRTAELQGEHPVEFVLELTREAIAGKHRQLDLHQAADRAA